MIITFNKLAAERRAYFSGSNISQGSVAIHIWALVISLVMTLSQIYCWVHRWRGFSVNPAVLVEVTGKKNEWVLNKAGVKKELLDTVKARKLAYYGHTMRKQGKLPGERDNARNNARCTQARKTTHGLDGQHQDVDRTPHGRVSQNDRGQR